MSMKFMVIKQKCNIVKVFGAIIKVTLVVMTKSFILPNFLKLLKRIFIYIKFFFDDFINVTLVFDDNRFDARKVLKPLKRNNLQQISLQWLLQKLPLYCKVSPYQCSNVLPLSPSIKVSTNYTMPLYLKKMLLSD